MEKNHPEKPFERYADDIVVHCVSEKQAENMLRQITRRMKDCRLTLHPVKTKIVDFRGRAQKRYPKGVDFLGFTIKPGAYKHNGEVFGMPGISVSQKSKNAIRQKFRDMNIHKCRTTLEHIAAKINPVISGIINYYHKFRRGDMRNVWNGLNDRQLKWVRWEKRLRKEEALRYLKTRYKEKPMLFAHWELVRP